MAEHAKLVGPEPDRDEVFFIRRGEVDQPQDASSRTLDPPRLQVVLEQGSREARLGSISKRKVPSLARSQLIQPVPVGPGT